ncbi:RNA polymerase sigma factor [Streptomyces chartreusis]
MTDTDPAFEACFSAHFAGLVAMATPMLRGDIGEAQDLVVDAFVRARKGWKGIDDPYAWLRVVIIHEVFYRSNRLRRRRLQLARVWALERTRTGTDPAALVEQHEDYDRVMEVLAALPDRQRVVAVLRWCEDWAPKEIAGLLGIAPSTVAKHLARAQTKLIRAFGEQGQALNHFSDLGKEQA